MGFHLLALRCLEPLLRQSSRVLLSSRREELPSSNCVFSPPSLCKHQPGLGFHSAPNLSFKSAFNLISMHRFSLFIARLCPSCAQPVTLNLAHPPTSQHFPTPRTTEHAPRSCARFYLPRSLHLFSSVILNSCNYSSTRFAVNGFGDCPSF